LRQKVCQIAPQGRERVHAPTQMVFGALPRHDL